jgi:hypothetical protein
MTARSGAKTLLSASHTSVTTPRGDTSTRTIAPCVLLGQGGNRLGRAVPTNVLIWPPRLATNHRSRRFQAGPEFTSPSTGGDLDSGFRRLRDDAPTLINSLDAVPTAVGGTAAV